MVVASLARSFLNESQLPVVLEPGSDAASSRSKAFLCDYLRGQREEVDRLLLQYGAILFRGFDLQTAEDFSDALESLDQNDAATNGPAADENENRRGVATDGNKTRILKNVYTSTEQPPSYRLPQHNEDSFTPNPPHYVLFFCHTPPLHQGETPLACSRKMYQALSPEIVDLFEQHDGVKYVRFYLPKMRLLPIKKGNVAFATWPQVFGTEDQAEVEQLCTENHIEFRWNRPFGALQTSMHLPAVVDHPVTGEKIWFNQAHIYNPTRSMLSLPVYLAYSLAKRLLAPKRFTFASFGDDTMIPTSVSERIHAEFDRLTVKFPWQKSDLILIDNFSTSHGRMPFRGPRRILAGMK